MVVTLMLAAYVAAADAPADWHQVLDEDVKIFTRPKAGTRIEEIKGDMLMQVSAAEVKAVLLDDEYARHAPYMGEYREISRPAPNKRIHYTRLALPLVDDRDYFIEITRESDLDEGGHGTYRSVWKPWGLDRPGRKGVVRIPTNEGYWEVKSTPDGHHASVEYYLVFDPGGAIPAWIAEIGNKRVLADVLRGIEKEALRRREASAKAP